MKYFLSLVPEKIIGDTYKIVSIKYIDLDTETIHIAPFTRESLSELKYLEGINVDGIHDLLKNQSNVVFCKSVEKSGIPLEVPIDGFGAFVSTYNGIEHENGKYRFMYEDSLYELAYTPLIKSMRRIIRFYNKRWDSGAIALSDEFTPDASILVEWRNHLFSYAEDRCYSILFKNNQCPVTTEEIDDNTYTGYIVCDKLQIVTQFKQEVYIVPSDIQTFVVNSDALYGLDTLVIPKTADYFCINTVRSNKIRSNLKTIYIDRDKWYTIKTLRSFYDVYKSPSIRRIDYDTTIDELVDGLKGRIEVVFI